MGVRRFSAIAAILVAGIALSGCSRDAVLDNSAEAAVAVGRVAVKGAVGATKLAVKGGQLAVQKARESRAPKSDFPVGTAVCENAEGGYYAALVREDGTLFCLPKEG